MGGALLSWITIAPSPTADATRFTLPERTSLTAKIPELGRISRLLEEGTIRPDVATVYALQDAAQAWKDITGNLSPSGPGKEIAASL